MLQKSFYLEPDLYSSYSKLEKTFNDIIAILDYIEENSEYYNYKVSATDKEYFYFNFQSEGVYITAPKTSMTKENQNISILKTNLEKQKNNVLKIQRKLDDFRTNIEKIFNESGE